MPNWNMGPRLTARKSRERYSPHHVTSPFTFNNHNTHNNGKHAARSSSAAAAATSERVLFFLEKRNNALGTGTDIEFAEFPMFTGLSHFGKSHCLQCDLEVLIMFKGFFKL
jgi:hypothetical protein